MTDDEYEPDPRSRHRVESSVSIGNFRGSPLEIDDGETHHVSGDVEIEVTGATPVDRPYTYELLEAIEQAVLETIDDFDGGSHE